MSGGNVLAKPGPSSHPGLNTTESSDSWTAYWRRVKTWELCASRRRVTRVANGNGMWRWETQGSRSMSWKVRILSQNPDESLSATRKKLLSVAAISIASIRFRGPMPEGRVSG